MIVESAQMLSTAHRMLDGTVTKRPSKSGKRMINYWVHPDSRLEEILYKVVHSHHPDTVWTMETDLNYRWHYEHFLALCEEFTYRYDKIHSTQVKLGKILSVLPTNIPKGPLTDQPLAMGANPECKNPSNIVESYRNFYQTKQSRFKMSWTRRNTPEWFKRAN